MILPREYTVEFSFKVEIESFRKTPVYEVISIKGHKTQASSIGSFLDSLDIAFFLKTTNKDSFFVYLDLASSSKFGQDFIQNNFIKIESHIYEDCKIFLRKSDFPRLYTS